MTYQVNVKLSKKKINYSGQLVEITRDGMHLGNFFTSLAEGWTKYFLHFLRIFGH